MKLENLQDLFVDEIEDIYDAEQQLVAALPKMANSATSPELKRSFQTHLEQTQGHVRRLEQIFSQLGLDPERKTCKAMKGLIAEGADMIHQDATPEVRDAGLISAAQRVEHYEIAAYGSARTYAETLGMGSHRRLSRQSPRRPAQRVLGSRRRRRQSPYDRKSLRTANWVISTRAGRSRNRPPRLYVFDVRPRAVLSEFRERH